jgi:hypothetical protein
MCSVRQGVVLDRGWRFTSVRQGVVLDRWRFTSRGPRSASPRSRRRIHHGFLLPGGHRCNQGGLAGTRRLGGHSALPAYNLQPTGLQLTQPYWPTGVQPYSLPATALHPTGLQVTVLPAYSLHPYRPTAYSPTGLPAYSLHRGIERPLGPFARLVGGHLDRWARQEGHVM